MHKNPVNVPNHVPLREIEAADRWYALSPSWSPCPPSLLNSVSRMGILNPLRLESLSNRLRIVCGFRRFAAAQAAGLDEIPAIIIPGHEGPDNFLLAVWENVGTRSLTTLEKATALHKLRTSYRIPEERLLSEFMEPLGLKPSRYLLQSRLELATLREPLQRAVDRGPLLFESVQRISGWSNDEQEFLIELIEQFQLGKNKQRQILDLLFDLRRTRQVEVREIWRSSGAESISEDQNLPPDQVFYRTRAALRKLRYPELTAHEEYFRKLEEDLELPPAVDLQVPENFEGDRIEIKFEVRSADEFRSVVAKLSQKAGRTEVDEIFSLI